MTQIPALLNNSLCQALQTLDVGIFFSKYEALDKTHSRIALMTMLFVHTPVERGKFGIALSSGNNPQIDCLVAESRVTKIGANCFVTQGLRCFDLPPTNSPRYKRHNSVSIS